MQQHLFSRTRSSSTLCSAADPVEFPQFTASHSYSNKQFKAALCIWFNQTDD